MPEPLLPLARRVAAATGWDATMREIMLVSKSLQPIPDTQRHEDNRVAGCLSQVWLTKQPDGTLLAWSDSKIIRGVLAVLLEKAADGAPLMADDYQRYLTAIGLERYLSESRTSGIRHVIHRLVSIR